MKRALFAAAVAASWCSLLLWAADVDWRSPLRPAVQRTFYGSDFRAVFGSATARDSRLHVEAAAADFSALQSTRPAGVEARDFQVLRYRFADFPRTLELSLVFRTAEHPDDVQTISLPWPGTGTSSFDLSHVAAWRGTIVEIGFAEFVTPQAFDAYAGIARAKGFLLVASSPLTRSSYHAGDDFERMRANREAKLAQTGAPASSAVTPAKAGVSSLPCARLRHETPAFAGVTRS